MKISDIRDSILYWKNSLENDIESQKELMQSQLILFNQESYGFPIINFEIVDKVLILKDITEGEQGNTTLMNFIAFTNGLATFHNYEVKFEFNDKLYDLEQEHNDVDIYISNLYER